MLMIATSCEGEHADDTTDIEAFCLINAECAGVPNMDAEVEACIEQDGGVAIIPSACELEWYAQVDCVVAEMSCSQDPDDPCAEIRQELIDCVNAQPN